MKLILLAIVGCALLASLSAQGTDALLIPPALNQVLARIKPGMTGQQVKEQLQTVYPNADGGISEWSGAVGRIVFKLDKHLSVKFSAQEPLSGAFSYKSAVLTENLRIRINDYEHKRSFEITELAWPPQEAKTSPEHPGTIFLDR
jgi:hypothetical protein